MYSAKIFKVTGLHFSYLLRRVQSLLPQKAQAPEEVIIALGQCQTVEQLLDFYFTTDLHVNEAFISLFEKRMQDLECPF